MTIERKNNLYTIQGYIYDKAYIGIGVTFDDAWRDMMYEYNRHLWKEPRMSQVGNTPTGHDSE